jgi:hypothetical protein
MPPEVNLLVYTYSADAAWHRQDKSWWETRLASESQAIQHAHDPDLSRFPGLRWPNNSSRQVGYRGAEPSITQG